MGTTQIAVAFELVSPDGQRYPVPKELFDAVKLFKSGRYNGNIQVEFKQGGIAGVKATQTHAFK